MKSVIQRVSSCSVTVNGSQTAKINEGLLVFLGVETQDSFEDIQWLSRKIVQLRIFNDENKKMNLSVKEVNGDIVVVSQFTLFASTKKGNRPSFLQSAKPEISMPLYNQFIKHLSGLLNKPVGTGVFGADMKIDLVNDGPVTIIIDTKEKV